jgi:hypothetical protein
MSNFQVLTRPQGPVDQNAVSLILGFECWLLDTRSYRPSVPASTRGPVSQVGPSLQVLRIIELSHAPRFTCQAVAYWRRLVLQSRSFPHTPTHAVLRGSTYSAHLARHRVRRRRALALGPIRVYSCRFVDEGIILRSPRPSVMSS